VVCCGPDETGAAAAGDSVGGRDRTLDNIDDAGRFEGPLGRGFEFDGLGDDGITDSQQTAIIFQILTGAASLHGLGQNGRKKT